MLCPPLLGAPGQARLTLGVLRSQQHATEQAHVLQEVIAVLRALFGILDRPEGVLGDGARDQRAGQQQRAKTASHAGSQGRAAHHLRLMPLMRTSVTVFSGT